MAPPRPTRPWEDYDDPSAEADRWDEQLSDSVEGAAEAVARELGYLLGQYKAAHIVKRYFHLRGLCDRALLLFQAREVRWHEVEERTAIRGELQTVRAKGIAVDRRLACMTRLPEQDRELLDVLQVVEDRAAEFGRKPSDTETVIRHVQDAVAEIEDFLGAERGDAVPASFAWESEKRRGPDRAPRRKPPPATPRRASRIVELLRKHPDGLSKNGIRKALHMGREEATRAVNLAVDAGTVVIKGSVMSPRICLATDPIRRKSHV